MTDTNKADDELDEPYLKGFEWDPEESWTRLKVHQSKMPLRLVIREKDQDGVSIQPLYTVSRRVRCWVHDCTML